VKLKNSLLVLTLILFSAPALYADDTPAKADDAATKAATPADATAKSATPADATAKSGAVTKKHVAGRPQAAAAGKAQRYVNDDNYVDLLNHDARFLDAYKNARVDRNRRTHEIIASRQAKAVYDDLNRALERLYTNEGWNQPKGWRDRRDPGQKRFARLATFKKFEPFLANLLVKKSEPKAGFTLADSKKGEFPNQDKVFEIYLKMVHDLKTTREAALGDLADLDQLGDKTTPAGKATAAFVEKMEAAAKDGKIYANQLSYAIQRHINAQANIDMLDVMGYKYKASDTNFHQLGLKGGERDSQDLLTIDMVDQAIEKEVIHTKPTK
jgi:hypothetical protein